MNSNASCLCGIIALDQFMVVGYKALYPCERCVTHCGYSTCYEYLALTAARSTVGLWWHLLWSWIWIVASVSTPVLNWWIWIAGTVCT